MLRKLFLACTAPIVGAVECSFPPFSNFVQLLSLLFLLPCFFGWMWHHTTANVLFYIKLDSHLKNCCFYLLRWKPFRNDRKCFFMLKTLSVLETFTFLLWLFGYLEKRLDKKAYVNLKIYDVTDWATNNYNTYIMQYLKK